MPKFNFNTNKNKPTNNIKQKEFTPINNYDIINPVASTKKPYFDTKKELFIFPIKRKYRYYVECALWGNDGGREYYILLGMEKFNPHCRLCKVDQYGKCSIKLRGEIKDFVEQETKSRGNIEFEYMESTEDFDVYVVV